MKKNKLYSSLATSVVLLMVLSACTQTSKTQAIKVPILRTVKFVKDPAKGVHAIIQPDVQSLIISHSVAKTLIESTSQTLRFNGQAAAPYVCVIQQAQLDTMKKMILGLQCSDTCPDSILCLGVVLGQTANALRTYFQPMLMCASSGTYTENNVLKQDFIFCKGGSYYQVNSAGEFEEITTQSELDSMHAAIALYQTTKNSNEYGVEVLDTAGVYRDFMSDAGDGTGHSTAVVFPIEEFISLAAYTGELKIWSVVNGMNVVIANDTVVVNKHDLIMSTGDVSYAGGQVTLPGAAKFADLSNICPPNCSNTKYKFHVLAQDKK